MQAEMLLMIHQQIIHICRRQVDVHSSQACTICILKPFQFAPANGSSICSSFGIVKKEKHKLLNQGWMASTLSCTEENANSPEAVLKASLGLSAEHSAKRNSKTIHRNSMPFRYIAVFTDNFVWRQVLFRHAVR